MISVLVMLFSPEIVKILGDTAYYDARMSAIPLIAVSYFSFLCYMLSQEEYFVQKTYHHIWNINMRYVVKYFVLQYICF